ncbi:MAG: sulfurtransferase TusA family protein [Sulfolobales archaeon]
MGEKRSEILRIREGFYMIDARGYMCPYPQILALKALESIERGSVLEIFVDNPASVENILNLARERGLEIVSVEKLGVGEFRISIRKR